jgi:uncharacterized DUF497 family protein
MRITFDHTKDAANLIKHGCSLSDASLIEWEILWAKPDSRRDYGTPRKTMHFDKLSANGII